MRISRELALEADSVGRSLHAAARRSAQAGRAPALVCFALVMSLLHAAAIWLAAKLIASAAAVPDVQQAVIAHSGDAVYGRLTLALVGNMQARGVGEWLSVVFSSGSSVVGVHVVQLIASLGMVAAGAAGIAWLRPGEPRRALDWPLMLLIACLAYGVGSTFRLHWGSGSGGDMVLSLLATKALGLDAQTYESVASHELAFSLGLNAVIVALAAAAGAAAGALLVNLRHLPGRPWQGGRAVQSATLAGALVATLAGAARPAIAFEAQPSTAPPSRPMPGRNAGPLPNLPSVVTIVRTPAGWEYRVNGRREIVRGIGYNAVTIDESPRERAAHLDRDFSSISAAGANIIAGWTETEFDDLLMQKAAEHGLGVILPFHIGPTYVLSEPDYAYEDPQVRQQLLDAISRRVEHFRNSPALRMWGLGNEVLHAIAWAHGSRDHAQAFADFLVQAADRVHQLDPNHPVIYRDAEDWYAGPIIQALAANSKPRPWLVYGMNFFTPRLQAALDAGPLTALDQPLLVSEFGPVGLRPEARPAGYRQLWDIIRAHPDRVLGGLAYAWTTAGPEPGDRNFGLTRDSGEPVDGTLAELAALYHSDANATAA